jgi:putative ABC transport system permease protein
VIRLLLAMLSARRGSALTALALAAVASAAAAAGPLYQAAAENAATTVEIAAAGPGERAVQQTHAVHRGMPNTNVEAELAPTLPYEPGFDTVYGLRVEGQVRAAGNSAGVLAGLVHRSGGCPHLVAVTGRCVSGANEVMISTRTAAALGLVAGDPAFFSAGSRRNAGFVPDGDPVGLTVVGTYRPRDGRDPYWAGRIFGTEPGRAGDDEVIFATRETVVGLPFSDATVAVDLVARRAAFDDPAALRTIVADARKQAPQTGYTVDSGIPDLLDRITDGGNALADGVRLAAFPLVLLCWFVLYLAVTNSAFRRRHEFGLAGLRGVPRFTRWWLSAAEHAIPLLLGGGIGYLGGCLAGAALADRVLPEDPPIRLDTDTAWYAAAAVGGALAVGLFAQWRATAAPVASLLRRVPVRRPAARMGAAEAVAIALAVVSGYQTRVGGGRPGLAPLTPMLIALAVSLVAARVVGLVADRVGRRALRRGALGRALAGLYLARQPGRAGLLGVLVTVFAVLGFAVTAVDVGATARTERVRAEMGAPRVLVVQAVPSRQLLSAVRTADPGGRYAMAVSRMPGSGLPLLAVDPARLARVAIWDSRYGPPAERVARSLQPREPTQVRITGREIEVRATVGAAPEKTRLIARVLAARGEAIRLDLGQLGTGTMIYRAAAPDCAAGGCRLLALEPSTPAAKHYDFDVTFHELRQRGPDRVVIAPDGFAEVGRWVTGGRNGVLANTARLADGIRVTYAGQFELGGLLRPVGVPTRLPVAATASMPATIPTGSLRIPVTRAVTLHLAPGLGDHGGLISMEYADLATLDPGDALDPQVWLTADAPANLVDRLREAGLVIVADRSTEAEDALLGRRGPALALRFYLLVALAAVTLGIGGVALVAAADRWGQTGQFRALRAQGLAPAVAWKVGFGGYAALIGAALLLGALAAALAWGLARTVIPFFADGGGSPYTPATPHPLVAAAALAGAALVLVGAGAVAAAILRRAVEGRQP